MVSRTRVEGLLASLAAVSGELELEPVLRRIVAAAAEVADARYAALGVLGADGLLEGFITAGLGADQVERIGALPRGHGLLGEIITHPVPLRVSDLAAHPQSSGFPADHPRMATFLGVPVRVGGTVFGNLYLTEKRSGDFDADDEELVVGLAATAGIAIQNARLFGEVRGREQAAAAASQITTSLLSGMPPEGVLELFTRRAVELCGATVGAVALGHQGRLLVEAAWSPSGQVPVGVLRPFGPCTEVMATGLSRMVGAGELDHVWPGAASGPGLVVPMADGVCLVAREPGAPPFTAVDTDRLTQFAAQATVALELAQRRRQAEASTVDADRDRIARDLHDLVIQRLFAAGMQLEGTVRHVEAGPAADRIHRVVDELDLTIREIRSAIYELSSRPADEQRSVRVRLLDEIEAAEESLGFAPSVRLSGLLETTLDPSTTDHLVCVLREALSNVARHAGARHVSVEVEALDGLVLRVVDDGVGVPAEPVRRSGLENMALRAEQLGGRIELVLGPAGGTRLSWRVPLPDRRSGSA